MWVVMMLFFLCRLCFATDLRVGGLCSCAETTVYSVAENKERHRRRERPVLTHTHTSFATAPCDARLFVENADTCCHALLSDLIEK